jgi:hypothetical protein
LGVSGRVVRTGLVKHLNNRRADLSASHKMELELVGVANDGKETNGD